MGGAGGPGPPSVCVGGAAPDSPDCAALGRISTRRTRTQAANFMLEKEAASGLVYSPSTHMSKSDILAVHTPNKQAPKKKNKRAREREEELYEEEQNKNLPGFSLGTVSVRPDAQRGVGVGVQVSLHGSDSGAIDSSLCHGPGGCREEEEEGGRKRRRMQEVGGGAGGV